MSPDRFEPEVSTGPYWLAPVQAAWRELVETELTPEEAADERKIFGAIQHDQLGPMGDTLFAKLRRWEREGDTPAALRLVVVQSLNVLVSLATGSPHGNGAPEPPRQWALHLGSLALKAHYMLSGDARHLDLWVDLAREASEGDAKVPADSPVAPIPLERQDLLADSYGARSVALQKPDDAKKQVNLLASLLPPRTDPALKRWIRLARAYLQEATLTHDNMAATEAIRVLDAGFRHHDRGRTTQSEVLEARLLLAECLALRRHDSDLEDRIACLRAAADLPLTCSERALALKTLADALAEQWAASGRRDDLSAHLQVLRALLPVSTGVAARYAVYRQLTTSLGNYYDLTGDPTALDEQIVSLKAAHGLSSVPAERSSVLEALALARAARYDLLSQANDLNEGIATLRNAREIMAPGTADRQRLTQRLMMALAARNHADDVVEIVDLAVNEHLVAPVGRPPHGRLALLLCPERAPVRSAWATLSDASGSRSASGAVPSFLIELSEHLHQQTRPGDGAGIKRQTVGALARTLVTEGPPVSPGVPVALGHACLELAEQSSSDGPDRWLNYGRMALELATAVLERELMVATETNEEHLLADYADTYKLLVTCHLRLARSDNTSTAALHRREAFMAAERSKGRRQAAMLAAALSRPMTIDSRYAQAITRLHQRLAERAQDRGVRARELTPEDVRDYAMLRGLHEYIATRDPSLAAAGGFAKPSTPEEVANALPPGGALVMLYPLERSIACFIIRQRPAGAEQANVEVGEGFLKVAAHEGLCDGNHALAELLERAFPEGRQGYPAVDSVLEWVLHKLSEALYPVLSELLRPLARPESATRVGQGDVSDVPTLILVPTGNLHRLPLHACPWPSRKMRLLDHYAVSYATSADVLVLARRKPGATSGVTTFAPGLKEYIKDRCDPPVVALAAAHYMAEKARLAGEPASSFLKEKASIAALVDGNVAGGRQVVYLGTHGRSGESLRQARTARSLPLSRSPVPTNQLRSKEPRRRDAAPLSGLLLYDRDERQGAWLLAAAIAAELRLSGVELLMLAACSTHADEAQPGDRLAGLLRAFFFAGARSVQATLWTVYDDASSLVCTWAWEELQGDTLNKAVALRNAVLKLRDCTGAEAAEKVRHLAKGLAIARGDDDRTVKGVRGIASALQSYSPHPFRHVTDWAPFVLHGDPRMAFSPLPQGQQSGGDSLRSVR